MAGFDVHPGDLPCGTLLDVEGRDANRGEYVKYTDLPSEQELAFLDRLSQTAQARITLVAATAEADFHELAIQNGLLNQQDNGDSVLLDRKKCKLVWMCERLTRSVLESYYDEFKVLPIPPDTIRRLLHYVLSLISIAVFEQKWPQFLPPDPNETAKGFFLAAMNRHAPQIAQYYAESLRIHQQRLAARIETGKEPPWPEELSPPQSDEPP